MLTVRCVMWLVYSLTRLPCHLCRGRVYQPHWLSGKHRQKCSQLQVRLQTRLTCRVRYIVQAVRLGELEQHRVLVCGECGAGLRVWPPGRPAFSCSTAGCSGGAATAATRYSAVWRLCDLLWAGVLWSAGLTSHIYTRLAAAHCVTTLT